MKTIIQILLIVALLWVNNAKVNAGIQLGFSQDNALLSNEKNFYKHELLEFKNGMLIRLKWAKQWRGTQEHIARLRAIMGYVKEFGHENLSNGLSLYQKRLSLALNDRYINKLLPIDLSLNHYQKNGAMAPDQYGKYAHKIESIIQDINGLDQVVPKLIQADSTGDMMIDLNYRPVGADFYFGSQPIKQ